MYDTDTTIARKALVGLMLLVVSALVLLGAELVAGETASARPAPLHSSDSLELVWGTGMEPRYVPAPDLANAALPVDEWELVWGAGEPPRLVRVEPAR